MSARRICDQINNVSFGLVGEGAALDANMHLVDHMSADISRVSWKSPTVDAALIYDDSATVNEYLSIVRDRNYSFLLNDGAFVQSSFTFRNNVISKHRLAYYACPFDIGPHISTIAELGIVDTLEDLLSGDQKSVLLLRSSLRFDYDPESAKQFHPASHMTFASNMGRVPLTSPFSFSSFVKFIFETFYEDHWKNRKVFRDWRADHCDRCLSEDDATRTHVVVG